MAVNSLPIGTLGFELYDTNNDRLLGTASIELPNLELQEVDVNGAGVLGLMSWPLFAQIQNMAATIHWRVLYDAAVSMMSNNAQFLTAYVASEHYDSGEGQRAIEGLKIVMRGLTQGLNLGNLEVGEQADTQTVLHLDYLKLSAMRGGNRETLLEFSRFDYTYVVNGQDLMQDFKAALGL